MGRAPLHTLVRSDEQQMYELYTQGQLQLRFRPADEAAWLAWLRETTSFAFHGFSGSLNVYREKRPRGGAYWYAYQTKAGRTRKRYLGRAENLSLAHLEETARSLSYAQQPVPATEQGMMLLSSRLAPPRLPNALVERERLLTALDDALDTSPTRFWVALIAALRRCPDLPSNFGENVVAQLQSPQPPPLSSCLSVLLHELEREPPYPAPIVLILDDYQVIEEPTIHQSLAFWVEHLPAHLHLILSSRVDPDLPLARLRAHGQLTEIRADELRFQEGEASQFLHKMLSPPLSEEELQRLVSRTEGWIAGLHLVALTVQKREDRAAYLETLTGSQRYLLDYVQEDILARLSPDTRDFLLHTAILSRLDAARCQAVTASPTAAASQHMLALLERANLFLVPLDEERRTYRLHDLFREALLWVLHTNYPELVPLLHRRAARFYEAQGAWHEAITHALQATDYSTAAKLMEQTVEQFWLRGEAATMARWALVLPEQTVHEHAHLLLTIALYLLTMGINTAEVQRERVHSEMRQLMARVETVLQREHGEINQEASATNVEASAVSPVGDREIRATEDVLLHRRLHLLHLYLVLSEVTASGDYERLSRMQREIDEELERDEEAIWQIIPLTCSFILHYTIRQEGASLLPHLLSAKERANRAESRYATYKVRQYLALVAVEAGRLHLAYEESRAALDLIKRHEGFALLKGYFEAVLAQVWYQWNRLEEARSLLHTVVHDAATWHQLDLLGGGYIELMQNALAIGDHPLVQQALYEVEELVQRERFGVYPGVLPMLRAQWWLTQGQEREAFDWAASVVFPEGSWERSLYYAFPVVIRAYFAEHRFREAASLLERWHAHLDRPANSRITLTYLAQSLVALHHTGRREQAHEVAARLFALTEPEGYLRVYLDEGELMRQALEALLTPYSKPLELASSIRASISQVLAVFEQERQGAGSRLSAPTPKPALSSTQQASAGSSAPGASLTQREQEVLRLLATGASNQDIARTLVIELPTVKKHVSNLLGKLRATSRTQAIALARARSLL
jgi:LuxR family maltose regulon positive regulatory protein